MARLLVEGLTKKYGKLLAIDNISFTVEDGQFVTLLGPTGCGKTTTLRVIAGLERQDSGNIYIGDTLVNDIQPKDRDIAMVFQSYNLYPHMNVYDNIAYPLKVRGMSREAIRQKVVAAAELLDLGHILSRRIWNLSGGEKQRVAIGRAIVREPKAYLMDEPLSNLDAKMRVNMRAQIKKLQARLKATILYVTHDQVEAMTMADAIAVINRGRLLQKDSPENLYNLPRNSFVAGFIGRPAMNLIECSCVERDGRIFLSATEFSFDVTQFSELVKPHVGSKLVLGARPEYITVSRIPIGQDSIEAVVDSVERSGLLQDLTVRVHQSTFLTVMVPVTEVYGREEKIWLGFDRNRIHIFDGITGEVLV